MTDPRRDIQSPELPPGRQVELPGRGTTFIRELPGPPGAPTLLLLHGWTATADLNWFTCYHILGQHFRIVAIDHRGHGRGIRSRRRFRLADCAEDAIAVADLLGVDRFVAIGYSMGGTIAQLIARDHPERLDGLVLCSTAGWFTTTNRTKLPFITMAGLAAVARVTPAQLRERITDQVYLQRKARQWEPWAIHEVSRHDWRTVLEAGQAIGAYASRDWLPTITTPTSVVITMNDRIVPTRRQIALFLLIPGAEAFRIDGDHDSVVALAADYIPLLIRAIRSTLDRTAAVAPPPA